MVIHHEDFTMSEGGKANLDRNMIIKQVNGQVTLLEGHSPQAGHKWLRAEPKMRNSNKKKGISEGAYWRMSSRVGTNDSAENRSTFRK